MKDRPSSIVTGRAMKKGYFRFGGLAGRAASVARLSILLLLFLPTAACYDAQHEVFGRKDGVVVPGLEGHYVRMSDISHFTVTREQHGRDYRITKDFFRSERGPQTRDEWKVGSLRAIPLGDGLYIAQVHCFAIIDASECDSPNLYALLLFHVTRSGDAIVKFEVLLPDGQAASAIARRDGVDVWGQTKKADGLSGSRAVLARFLRDLATVPLKSGDTYLRVSEGGQ